MPSIAPASIESAPPRGSYTLEIQTPRGVNTTTGKRFSLNLPDVSLDLKDGNLTVNGKDLGALEEGSTITVKEGGKVLVNGDDVE